MEPRQPLREAGWLGGVSLRVCRSLGVLVGPLPLLAEGFASGQGKVAGWDWAAGPRSGADLLLWPPGERRHGNSSRAARSSRSLTARNLAEASACTCAVRIGLLKKRLFGRSRRWRVPNVDR